MGRMSVTNMTLQMADRSIKHPLGVLEDVPVRGGKFFIPVDFVVLDMAEDTQIPIFLGRPFLHTAGAIIDVRRGRLTLTVGHDTIVFNLEKAFMKHPMIEKTCHSIDVVHFTIDECLAMCLSRDPLEIALISDSAAETGSWSQEVDEIEKLLTGEECPKQKVYSLGSPSKATERCEESNLVLNWEKCHFMVTEGVVLGHLVSSKGIQVDKAKVKVIERLLYPVNVKSVRSFLSHAGFYRRLQIRIYLLRKCVTPVIMQLEPFWVREKIVLHAIYYETLNYLLAKKEAKPRLICWILLLQEYDLEIRDKSGAENIVADHLSHLRFAENDLLPIDDSFSDDHLLDITTVTPWFADYANYLVGGILPPDLSYQQEKRFMHDVKRYFWDDPYLFQECADAIATPTCDANAVLKLFQKIIFPRFGVPCAVISDGGKHFDERHINSLLKKYGVTHRRGLRYHPQTSGQVEVSNKELKSILEKVVSKNRKAWSRKLRIRWSGPFTVAEVNKFGLVTLQTDKGETLK
ncbi:uncharacterized protein LOC141632313 [Silene latifolia]|uniref:uncharacterized protein LOC141632313 n=1 Tax=Silene latifolia TaxID=37657 RepID=UPI003D76C4A7